jgi:hypothetical protein
MKELFFYGVLAFIALRVLVLFRLPFAVRLWRYMRQIAYAYVALVILLAIISLVTGKTL